MEILLITWKAGQDLSEVSKWVGQSLCKKIMQLKNKPTAKNYTNDRPIVHNVQGKAPCYDRRIRPGKCMRQLVNFRMDLDDV